MSGYVTKDYLLRQLKRFKSDILDNSYDKANNVVHFGKYVPDNQKNFLMISENPQYNSIASMVGAYGSNYGIWYIAIPSNEYFKTLSLDQSRINLVSSDFNSFSDTSIRYVKVECDGDGNIVWKLIWRERDNDTGEFSDIAKYIYGTGEMGTVMGQEIMTNVTATVDSPIIYNDISNPYREISTGDMMMLYGDTEIYRDNQALT